MSATDSGEIRVRMQMLRLSGAAVACAGVLIGSGCVAREPGPATARVTEPARPAAVPVQQMPSSMKPSAANPGVQASASSDADDVQAYLRQVLERCRALEQYTLTFTRQERRGLAVFMTLREPEVIEVKFRRRPFSVRMRWLDPNIKYGESTFVMGQEDNKVRFVPRHGLFGLPPALTRVDLQTPVIWGESRRPLTDFGLERMVERTLESIGKSQGLARLTDEGLADVPLRGFQARRIHIEYPAKLFTAPLVDLYIDPATNLPVCSRICLPSGAIDGLYLYENLNPNVKLTDADFVLDAERPVTASGG